MENWTEQHGCLETILRDQGKQYIAQTTVDYFKHKGVRQINSTQYKPTGNSISERINQDIRFILAHFKNTTITELTTLIHRRLKYTHHHILQCTPYELIHGLNCIKTNKQ